MARRRALSSQDNAGLRPLIALEGSQGGSSGGSGRPLVRTKWIDAYTITPSGAQNGAAGTPYVSIPTWLSTLGAPSSADDAGTLELALLSPSGSAEGSGETWTIPAGRQLEVRSPSGSFPSNRYTTPTIAWANTYVGASKPASTVLTLTDINLNGFVLTASDVATAPNMSLQFLGSTPQGGSADSTNGAYLGAVNYAACTNSTFVKMLVQNCDALITVAGTATPTVNLTVLNATWVGVGLSAVSVTAVNSSFTDSGASCTTTGTQTYTGCAITATKLESTGNGTQFFFTNCTFDSAVVVQITGTTPIAQFDGPSWASFQAAGGTLAGSTVAVVVGGYTKGAVAGANVASPAGNACTVSLTGAGASTGFTGGGNWYTATALAANTTTTISDAGGAVAGTTMRFTRTDTSGNTWTILDAAAGAITTIAPGGSTTVYFSGTAWVLQ